jgi:hypothetical protein
MNNHYNTANYNQCPSYNLVHPLHTMVAMPNNSIPYPMPIPYSLPSTFNIETYSNHNPILSLNAQNIQKRKVIDGPLESSSSSPLSTSSYSSTASFPRANTPLKKSKSTPVPTKKSLSKQSKVIQEESESPEEEAKSRQRNLERNRLAGRVLRYIFFCI